VIISDKFGDDPSVPNRRPNGINFPFPSSTPLLEESPVLTTPRNEKSAVRDEESEISYNGSRPLLTGTGSQTEFDVTRRKQTTGLTRARTAIIDLAIWRNLL